MMKLVFIALTKSIMIATSLFVITFLITNNSQAEEIPQPDSVSLEKLNRIDDVKQGQLLFKSDTAYSAAPLLKTNVEFIINGMILRAIVKQEFKNTTNDWQEGIYVFPLPETAAVDTLNMLIGEKKIEGKIKERQQAKRLYQQAKTSGKKASLIEQERPNIFTNSVANIAPGEKIVIEIEYQQVVRYDAGKFSLRFPMVVAPRYIPGDHIVTGFSGSGWALNTNEVDDASRITPKVSTSTHTTMNPVEIKIQLNAGFNLKQIHSPYHAIRIENDTKSNYTIFLQQDTTPANRDFELVWQPELNNEINAAMFTETWQGDEYALLMMMPNIHQKAKPLQREMIYVIDTSGSMAGESIKQAKSALLMAIKQLQPGDRFNIIQFNSYTHSLFAYPESFSSETYHKAQRYIQNLHADGGTEMLSAMKTALQQHNENHQLRQVIFITDGNIGNEAALFEVIQSHLKDTRLFPVGIGSAPNSHFMNGAAKFGRGSFTYIGNTSEVEEKMHDLLLKIATPLLTNINLKWQHQDNSHLEIWPQSIPDLYQSEPLLIAIKTKQLPKSVEAMGNAAEQTWHQQVHLQGGDRQTGIAKLWARKKIEGLMDLRHNNPEHDSLKKQITEVALEHHLVSKYTSLVAVDVTPTKPVDSQLKTHAIETNLPQGWQREKVFGPMPQTATPALLHFIIGLLLLGMRFSISFWRN